jgi:hypothetical protein
MLAVSLIQIDSVLEMRIVPYRSPLGRFGKNIGATRFPFAAPSSSSLD